MLSLMANGIPHSGFATGSKGPSAADVRQDLFPVHQVKEDARVAGGVHAPRHLVNDRRGLEPAGVGGEQTRQMKRQFLDHARDLQVGLEDH